MYFTADGGRTLVLLPTLQASLKYERSMSVIHRLNVLIDTPAAVAN